MTAKEVVVIRVITSEDASFLNAHGRLLEQYYPMLHTASYCIEDQPNGICDEATKRQALPKILRLAEAHRDADAILISCCDDPGVRELRQSLKTPVIGAGSSVCSLAAACGRRIGLIGITDYPPDPYPEILGERLIHLGRPENVSCTLDLLTEAGRLGVIRQAQKLKNMGADSIALACTGMSTIGIAAILERECGIPVIDPVMAEGLFAYYACLKAENLKILRQKGETYHADQTGHGSI